MQRAAILARNIACGPRLTAEEKIQTRHARRGGKHQCDDPQLAIAIRACGSIVDADASAVWLFALLVSGHGSEKRRGLSLAFLG